LQAKEDASELVAKKAQEEEKRTELKSIASEKQAALHKKLITIGNIVHDSVPISDNEVKTIECYYSRDL